MDQEQIRHIIYTANRAGFGGIKIIDWIPPQNATDDYHGTFVYLVEMKAVQTTAEQPNP